MNKRCERKGHKEQTKTFQIFKKPDFYWNGVAELHDRTEKYCSRCKEVFSTTDEFITRYDETSWPTEMYLIFEKQGWVKA